MPQTIKHKRTARKIRRPAPKRKSQQGIRCKGSQRVQKKAPAIIGGSVYDLRLQAIPGIMVEENVSRLKQGHYSADDYVKMYYDVMEAYRRYCGLTGTEPMKMDPLSKGLGIGVSFSMLMSVVKQLLPGMEVNIDRYDGDNKYYLSFFKEVSCNSYWHYFEIKPVVEYLAKKDKKLLLLFTRALAVLMRCCGFGSWWNGNLYAYDCLLQDEFYMMDFIDSRSDDDADHAALEEQYRSAKELYFKGKARKYQDLISAATINIKAITKEAGSYRNDIARWIKMAMELEADGLSIEDFDYNSGEGVNEEGCISLRDQYTIIWEEGDIVFSVTSEYMDNEAANFGAQCPVFNLPVSGMTNKIATDKIEKAMEWMKKIDRLFESYAEIIRKLKK